MTVQQPKLHLNTHCTCQQTGDGLHPPPENETTRQVLRRMATATRLRMWCVQAHCIYGCMIWGIRVFTGHT